MKTPKLNRRLIRRIITKLKQRPKQFVMRTLYDDTTESGGKPSHCGTAACLYGWALVLAGKYKSPRDGSVAQARRSHLANKWRAERLFGVENADSIIWSSKWPNPFRDRFEQAKSPAGHVRAAVQRLEYLLKTGA